MPTPPCGTWAGLMPPPWLSQGPASTALRPQQGLQGPAGPTDGGKLLISHRLCHGAWGEVQPTLCSPLTQDTAQPWVALSSPCDGPSLGLDAWTRGRSVWSGPSVGVLLSPCPWPAPRPSGPPGRPCRSHPRMHCLALAQPRRQPSGSLCQAPCFQAPQGPLGDPA